MDLALNNLQRLICHKTQAKTSEFSKSLFDEAHTGVLYTQKEKRQ